MNLSALDLLSLSPTCNGIQATRLEFSMAFLLIPPTSFLTEFFLVPNTVSYRRRGIDDEWHDSHSISSD
jgi:hypothetical protein